MFVVSFCQRRELEAMSVMPGHHPVMCKPEFLEILGDEERIHLAEMAET